MDTFDNQMFRNPSPKYSYPISLLLGALVIAVVFFVIFWRALDP